MTASAAQVDRRLAGGRWVVVPLVAAAMVAGVVAAPGAAMVPPAMLVLALVAVALVVLAYAHPPAAVYLLLVVTPLTAGLERSAVVPLLRPHEALGLLLGTGVALRAVVQLATGQRLLMRLTRLDGAIALFATTGSVLPLLWMVARGSTPTAEDVLYAAQLWKFYGLFILVRACVRTERQVRRCLYVSLAAASIMAIIAILQALGIGGVPDLVTDLFPIEGGRPAGVGRGSSTLGSAIAVGDVTAVSLAICLGLLRSGARRRWLVVAAALFATGGPASGQFSGVLATGIAVFVVAVVAGQVKRLLLGALPAAVVAAVVLRPVIQARLADFDFDTGLPHSWWVRLENLRLWVWPQLSGANWVFGVRPAARIDVSAPWATSIYIESGHTWLLWTGGVPFLLAYLYFTWVGVRVTARPALHRRDAVGAAAVAALAGLFVVFVLMSFDPHITMRGTADLLFSLLALATVRSTVPGGDRHGVQDPRVPARPAEPADDRVPGRRAGADGRAGSGGPGGLRVAGREPADAG